MSRRISRLRSISRLSGSIARLRRSVGRLGRGHIVVVVVQQALLLIEHAGERALAADAHTDQNGDLRSGQNETQRADDASGLVLLRARHAEARRGGGGRGAASHRRLLGSNEGVHVVAHSHRHHRRRLLGVDGRTVVVLVVAARSRSLQLPGSTTHTTAASLRRNVQLPLAVLVNDTVADLVEVARDGTFVSSTVPDSALVVALARALRLLLAAAHIAGRVRLRGVGLVPGVHELAVVAHQLDLHLSLKGIHLHHRLVVQRLRVVAARGRIALLIASITNRVVVSRRFRKSEETLLVHSEVGSSERGETNRVPLLSTRIVPTVMTPTDFLLVDAINTRVLSHHDEDSHNQNNGRKKEAQAKAAAATSRTRSAAGTVIISAEVVVKTKVVVSASLSVTFSLSLGHSELEND